MFGGKDRKDKEKERKDEGVKNAREGRRWVLMSTCVFLVAWEVEEEILCVKAQYFVVYFCEYHIK